MNKMNKLSRNEFLRLCACSAGTLAVLPAMSGNALAQAAPPANLKASGKVKPAACDLREFVHWIITEFEPSVRLPGGAGRYARQPGQTTPELYGVADMACILYTLGKLHPTPMERAEWASSFQWFQNPDTGWLVEKKPTHTPMHNTAFALGAMQLLDLKPQFPVKMGAEYSDIHAFFNTLNWRTAVYADSITRARGSAPSMPLCQRLARLNGLRNTSPNVTASLISAMD